MSTNTLGDQPNLVSPRPVQNDKPYCREMCKCSQIKYQYSTEDLLIACNEIAFSLNLFSVCLFLILKLNAIIPSMHCPNKNQLDLSDIFKDINPFVR